MGNMGYLSLEAEFQFVHRAMKMSELVFETGDSLNDGLQGVRIGFAIGQSRHHNGQDITDSGRVRFFVSGSR